VKIAMMGKINFFMNTSYMSKRQTKVSISFVMADIVKLKMFFM